MKFTYGDKKLPRPIKREQARFGFKEAFTHSLNCYSPLIPSWWVASITGSGRKRTYLYLVKVTIQLEALGALNFKVLQTKDMASHLITISTRVQARIYFWIIWVLLIVAHLVDKIIAQHWIARILLFLAVTKPNPMWVSIIVHRSSSSIRSSLKLNVLQNQGITTTKYYQYK